MRCNACGNQSHSSRALACNRCGQPLRGTIPLNGGLVGGCYRIISALGRGGMGAVYLAEDQRALGRLCVVKELLPYAGPAGSPGALDAARRFEEEARTLTRLRHPSTPQVFAYIEEHGRHFIAMEYISGADLEQALTHTREDGQLVRGQPQPLEQTLRDGVEICRILEYLARQSPPVVHHDIKPANLIRDAESHAIFLVDFGSVARPLAKAQGVASVYGTPGYAAPECYRNMSDPKSDVYALAATLYHLLTDDDPREHPLQFPKLSALPAPVAAALRAGLEPELGRRCDAQMLRRSLEYCLQSLVNPVSVAAAAPPAEGLIFPGGERPTDVAGLVEPCLKWWRFAATLLQDGRLLAFLARCGRADLARALEQDLLQGQSADAVLDQLLRFLAPGLPAPSVERGARHISFGVLAPGLQNAVPLVLHGRGGLAHVSATTRAPWLQFYPEQVVLRPGEQEVLQLSVNTDYTAAGALSGSLVLRVYDARSQLVTAETVEVSAEIAGSRPNAARLDVIWLLLILAGAATVLALLLLLRPPGWALLSVLWLGTGVGAITSLIAYGARDLLTLLLNALTGTLGALAGGLVIPIFLLRRALPTASPGQFLAALAGALAATLLVNLFLDS